MASMERFTQRARHVLALAHQEAEQRPPGIYRYGASAPGFIGGRRWRGRARPARTWPGDRTGARDDPTHQQRGTTIESGKIELAADTQQVLEFAIDEARKMGHHYIGTEHLLLGLVRSEGTAMEVLKKLGVTPDQIRRQTRRVLQESTGSGAQPFPRQPRRAANRKPRPRWWTNWPPT